MSALPTYQRVLPFLRPFPLRSMVMVTRFAFTCFAQHLLSTNCIVVYLGLLTSDSASYGILADAVSDGSTRAKLWRNVSSVHYRGQSTGVRQLHFIFLFFLWPFSAPY
ncbi:hypothetical protein ASPBRDRAFT_419136 [Aspergillus brasiliensis CBS 101740]|uniref:Uncharacterized protein n=1 Tax=Aspergillus brasiliensis (strain CBS 101740 / IMI 381727 / IBT 21946) TaxID=767769 RepID=A0A1L9U4D1_ASPBC|nr:hypothetical protein ASPBRDRAFT_419136 [Aspergillus brasiliensis CBS 101740]